MTTPLRTLTVRTPATTANLGPGFDSFGMALTLYNTFTFQEAETDQIIVHPESSVPLSDLKVKDNLLFRALDTVYHHFRKERPAFHVTLQAHIPMARGLGSSSTAIAAGLCAGNYWNDRILKPSQLVELGTLLEGHPDNIAPALLGGTLLCDGTQSYPLPWPSQWKVLLAVPAHPLLTETARKAMPEHYVLSDAIFNLRKASLLTYSLLKEDAEAFRSALDDRLHHPYRGNLIPEFAFLKQLAETAGALGVVISGAGSTLAIFHEAYKKNALMTALETFKATQAPDMTFLALDRDEAGTVVVVDGAET